MNRKEKRMKKKELNILQEVINVINQYFPELINKLEGLTDLRNQSYVKYQMKVIFIVRLLGLMCEIKTMNELTRELNTEETIKNIAQICGLELDEFKTVVEENNESIKENYEYVTGLDYREEKVNIIKHTDTKKKTEYVYITDLAIRNKNIEETVNVGRKRWKIENEGFKIQKNGTFDIGHLCSKDSVAIKVHYLLIQITHIIRQLIEKGIKNIKELGLKIKEISQKIKQELISSKIYRKAQLKKTQLRFD